MHSDIQRKNCIKRRTNLIRTEEERTKQLTNYNGNIRRRRRTVQTKAVEVRCAYEPVQKNGDIRIRGRDLD